MDQKGHGRALQLTPSWGDRLLVQLDLSAQAAWRTLLPALDRNFCLGSHGSSPRAEPPGCLPQHPHYIPAWSPESAKQGKFRA